MSSDDSVPELADAIQKLINSRPYSPSKPELEKVIRDHVTQELMKATGSTWGDGTWGPTSGSSATIPVLWQSSEHCLVEHSWAQVESWNEPDVGGAVVVFEQCRCGVARTRVA